METKTDRQTEIDRLVKIREANGTISEPEYNESLERLGKPQTAGCRGALRRDVRKVHPAPPHPGRDFTMDEDLLIGLAKSKTLAQFHRDQVADIYGTSFSSFYRALQRQIEPALLAYLKPGRGGMNAFRSNTLSCLWNCEHFGEAWQTDVVELPVRVVPPGRGQKNPARVKLIGVIDDATRLIVGWGIVYCRDHRDVRAADVAGVLIGAMHRYGVPQQVVMDNGNEFDNKLIAQLMKRSASYARMTPRYRGESKGKIERFNWTVQGWLAREYASWTAGSPSSARYSLQGANNTKAPRHEQFHAALTHWIDVEYNTVRKHSAHGLTPIDAYNADTFDLIPLELHRVLGLGPVDNAGRDDQWVSVQRYGINHRNQKFLNIDVSSPGRGNLSGLQSLARQLGRRSNVQIREVNGDPTLIGVYDNHDRFLCIATRMDCIDTETKFANRTRNDSILRQAELAMRDAQHQLEAEFPDIEDDDESDETHDPRSLSVIAIVADILNTEHRNLRPRYNLIHHDSQGSEHLVNTLEVSDDTCNLTWDTCLEVLAAWTSREHREIYRLDTPTQALSYQADTSSARLVNKNTGEVEQMLLHARAAA